MDLILSGIQNLIEATGLVNITIWQGIMMFLSCLLLYLAIVKGFEPLLLIPIGFGGLLANVPFPGGAEAASNISHTVQEVLANGHVEVTTWGGILGQITDMGIASGLFPVLIFMGVGAMTDFGPLIANPRTAFLGAAAQFGIFTSLLLAVVIGIFAPMANTGIALVDSFLHSLNFNLFDAGAIGIIGGADGPTAIFVTRKLSPDLLGAIAVAAYSYMALVPIIQPPIMRALTSKKERAIKMVQLREVSKAEKILFPIMVFLLCAMLLPDATPLIGALMFGNLAKESGVVDRLSDTMQNALINIVTILLGLGVGSKLAAQYFLTPKTLAILALGLLAFCIGTATGVLLAKLMNLFSKNPINPLIGSAGVSAVPMAARVSNKVGQESDPHNFLLMHAMGPNVAGVIGSAIAAGVLLAIIPRLAGG